LFERGRFTPQDTAAVSHLLVLYLGVLIGGSLGEILSKTFFSLSDSRTPTIVRMTGFVVGAVLKLWWGLQFGMAGLVWATSVYYLLISALDGILLYRRLGRISFVELFESIWKCVCGSVAAMIAASLLLSSHISSMIIPAVIGSGIVYLGSMMMLRDSIALRLTTGIRQRLWSK
jgi:putative peptidoglycan lipid II flippase